MSSPHRKPLVSTPSCCHQLHFAGPAACAFRRGGARWHLDALNAPGDELHIVRHIVVCKVAADDTGVVDERKVVQCVELCHVFRVELVVHSIGKSENHDRGPVQKESKRRLDQEIRTLSVL
jgi:hypothetical protein